MRETVLPPQQDQYVYDLYYLNKRDFDFRLLEDMKIEAFQNVSPFDWYRDAEELEVYDDEDDSNDENNWRNDYPDEDPKFFEREGSEGYFGNGKLLGALRVNMVVVNDFVSCIVT